jgi:UDP-glucose:(heptosyl)LPS alpha-1,3-glucosyltransferase
MKLAIVRQRYNPYGGAERFIARAAAALSAQGTVLTIIAREWSGPRGGASWMRCDPFYVGRLWRDAGFAHAVCGITGHGQFDLVQSHERLGCCDIYRAGDGVHAQWLAHRARTLSPFGKAVLALNPYHRYVLAAERRLFTGGRLRAVICNSRMVRDDIRRWFGVADPKLHVIYNGVDLDDFHPRLKSQYRAALRASLGIPGPAPVVLFVGSGFERKGLAQLISAFARWPEPEARLLVVGRDSAQAGLERLARSLGVGRRVHWAGGQADVRPWYGAADVFALPTLYDPFPNAALEAMASGLPVVTTAQCGAAELIEDGVNGYVCRDILDTAELVANLAKVTAQAGRLGENARTAAEPLGIAAMAQKLLRLYGDLLERANAPT